MKKMATDVRALIADAVRYHQAGQLGEAIARYRQVLAVDPESASVHNNLGTALYDRGLLEEAEASYRLALAFRPRDAEAHNNLGTLLYEQGKTDEAIASYRKAIALRPDHAEAHNNLGTALVSLGRLGDALESYRRALAFRPDYVAARVHLGTVLWEQGQLEEAAAAYREALEFNPRYTDALDRLAAVTLLLGNNATALDVVWRSLQIAETEVSKRLFVDIAKKSHWTSYDSRFRTAVIRALAEPWARPSELARASADLVKLTPGIGDCVARAAQAWPRYLSAQELFGPVGPAVFSADELLCGLLSSTQNIDVALERFLTMARRLMLNTAIGAPRDEFGKDLGFYSALARQCFINEYVFFHAADEIRQAADLRDALVKALEENTPVPSLWVITVAAYFPLHSLPSPTRLLEMQWPAPVAALMTQQVADPLSVQELRDTMPRLTAVEDGVSQKVRDQYEENPYPRWVRTALVHNPVTMAEYLNRKFPLALFRRETGGGRVEVLSAGCGTGITAIEFAAEIRNSHLLAVDLSLLSLGYAKLKARDLGLTRLDFAQADILQLGAIDRRFDVIECSGVLHHMADAFAGWHILLSLLRPGGFMLVGLYSEIARRDIVRVRQHIAKRRFGVSSDDIRQCRQELLELNRRENLGIAVSNSDFFGTSTCRDLLFHSHEQRMTLNGVAAFLKDNNLAFLGFEIEDRVLHAYRKRFPDDPAAINLDHWRVFERDNPTTFSSMYMLWIQKTV